MLENFITIFVFNLLIVSVLFVISLWIKKADIIDIYWGPAFLLSSLIINFNINEFNTYCIFKYISTTTIMIYYI